MAKGSDTAQNTLADCFTCEIVEKYVGLTNAFTQDIAEILLPGMTNLFMAIVGLWVVYNGIKITLSGKIDIPSLGKDFVFICIAAVLMAGQGPDLVNKIYNVTLGTMGAAGSLALEVARDTNISNVSPTAEVNDVNGMVALVQVTETSIRDVFGTAWNIYSQVSMTGNYFHPIYALALIIPYFLILVVYFSRVVIAIFRVLIIAVLSPYLMLGFGFSWGRGMSVAAVKTLLASFVVLFASTAAVAVVMYGVTELKIGVEGGIDPADVSLTKPEYLVAVALGWMGTALIAEATSLANSITGAALSNSAAAILTGGITGTALGMAKAAGGQRLAMAAATGGTSEVARFGGQALGVRDGAQAVIDKIKSYRAFGTN